MAITKDKAMKRRAPERAAVKKAKLAWFSFKVRNDCKAEELGEIFLRALPRIKRFLARNQPPFMAKITRAGIVEMEVDFR